MKKAVIGVATIAGLVMLAVLGLGLFLDANQFRPQMEGAIGGALGRKVSIGNVKLALFSGGMSIDDLSIADDPAFSTAPFVTAKTVTVGIDLMPLLLSRTLEIKSFRLEKPEVVLLNSSAGQWNFSGLGAQAGSASSTAAGGSTAAMGVVIRKLEIAGGRILVGTPGVRGKERVYEDVNLEVSSLSLTSQFPFRLTAKTPGGGTVTLDGKAGPLSTLNVADTPFDAAANVSHLDVATTGFIDPASGLAGLIDFKGSLASEAGRLVSKGLVHATGMQLVAGGTPARVPVTIDYESDYSRKARTGIVKRGEVHIGKAVAQLTGDYNAGGAALSVRLKLAGDKMPAPDLEAALPAIGMTMPSGASLTQGTIGVRLAINGPVDHLVISGPITLANATVAGFDLGSKLSALPSFAGAPASPGHGGTILEMLAATIRVAPDGIRADSLNLVAPAFGTLTGGGTIDPAGNLDFRMLAKLTGALGASEVSRVASFGKPANGIPFRIQGVMANPIFVPDVGRVVDDLVKDPETVKKAAGLLGGFFGGKKR